MSGPLDGVRVVELATVLMAPFAGQLLGDLGADVVKVESDRHDAGRIIGGGGHHQISGAAVNLQRNKRSIQVDLKQPAGRDVLIRLVAGADVFITNMRTQAASKLGLDYESLAKLNPGLVYCHTAGFDDSRARLAGNDQVSNSVAGTCWEDGGMKNFSI